MAQQITIGNSRIKRFRRLLRNVALDLKYGSFLGGSIQTRYGDLGAYNTVNSDYELLSHLFHGIEIRESDVLVDVGCGKGRVINWWLSRGMKNKMIGVEIDEAIAATTRRRLRKHSNVEIIHGNVLDVLPARGGTIYYLFNPFSADIVRQFRDRLKAHTPRELKIIYYFATHKDAAHVHWFRDDPKWKVKEIPISSASQANAVLIELA